MRNSGKEKNHAKKIHASSNEFKKKYVVHVEGPGRCILHDRGVAHPAVQADLAIWLTEHELS